MRCCAEENFTFLKRLADKREIIVFEITQTAMNQLGAGGRGVRGQVVLFAQQDLQAAPGCIARDAGAVNPASDNQDVVQRT